MSAVPKPLELHEVRPPSAYGGDFSRFWDLLRLVSISEFQSQYANTFLGFLWTIVRPLVFFGVIFLVLREALGVGADVPGYGESLVLSLILFTFFADATTRSVRSIVAKESMVRKMKFPRIIIPLSVNITATFTLALNLLAVLPLLLAFGLRPRTEWLLFPLLVIGLIVLTMALSMILSVLFIRVRDTAQGWSLISRMLFYGSPILYPLEIVPVVMAKVVAVSPLTLIFAQTRVWVVTPEAESSVEIAGPWLGLALPLSIMAGLCVLALWIFQRDAPRVAERL